MKVKFNGMLDSWSATVFVAIKLGIKGSMYYYFNSEFVTVCKYVFCNVFVIAGIFKKCTVSGAVWYPCK